MNLTDAINILLWLLFGMLMLRFLVVTFNFISQPYLTGLSVRSHQDLVSVLIPARNEAHTLPKLLSDLQNVNYPNLEIIVCNDNSTDETLDVLKKFGDCMPNLGFFTNDELPSGWVGKNYACHKLALSAKGDYLLFLDADVRIMPDSIGQAINYLHKRKLGLLSIFPQQVMESRGEWATVPIMNWILLSFLPLLAVQMRWFSSLAAGNGQFMLFDAGIYRQNLWHQKVWNKNVEDILIARNMKRLGIKIAVLTGNNDVFCRMYTSRNAAITGFSRNIHYYFGGSRFWMTSVILIMILRLPLFAIYERWWMLLVGVVFIVLMKIMVAITSNQSVLKIFVYHFSQLKALLQIGLRNLQIGKTRKIEWKGRVYRNS